MPITFYNLFEFIVAWFSLFSNLNIKSHATFCFCKILVAVFRLGENTTLEVFSSILCFQKPHGNLLTIWYTSRQE